MAGVITFLGIALFVSLFVNIFQGRLFQKLKYILLTNGKMSFFDDASLGFRIKVHSKTPWHGGIGYVYRVFSSPGVYQSKLEIAEHRDTETPSVDKDFVYETGSWKDDADQPQQKAA